MTRLKKKEAQPFFGKFGRTRDPMDVQLKKTGTFETFVAKNRETIYRESLSFRFEMILLPQQ